MMERESHPLAPASGLIPLNCSIRIKWGTQYHIGLLLEFNKLTMPKCKHFTEQLAPRISQYGSYSLIPVPAFPLTQ